MPLNIIDFPAAPECAGRQWAPLDEDQLATLVATVLIGLAEHAVEILRGAQRQTVMLPQAFKAQLRIQLFPDPGPQTWHRDGLLFEIISWIATYMTALPNELISVPHLTSTQQGLDTIKIRFDPATKSLVRAVIFEQKCTEHPRDAFRDKVLPAFVEWKSHRRDGQLAQAVQSLLDRANLTSEQRIRLYDTLVQQHPLNERQIPTCFCYPPC